MSVAVFSGSFDPITMGHLHIIKTASKMCNCVIVAVAHNPNKQYMFSYEERAAMVYNTIVDWELPNVVVESLAEDELTVEFAKSHHANILVRGIRNSSDMEYEQDLMMINDDIKARIGYPDLNTLFVLSPKSLSSISSSMVRMLIKNPKTIELTQKYVNKSTYEYIKDRYGKVI